MRNVIYAVVFAATLVANVATGAEQRPVMKTMPTTRQDKEENVPLSTRTSAPSRTRTSTASVGCLSGDCALARARAAQTVTRSEAMAQLNEKYRQREIQRQEARAAARARLTNQNIDAER